MSTTKPPVHQPQPDSGVGGVRLDFTDLTEIQQAVLTFQGWAPGSKLMPRPRGQSMRKLIERGLVVPREVNVWGARCTAYDVPIPIHAAWCAFCAEQNPGATT